MDNESTVPIQNLEGTADIQIGDVDMPTLMRSFWLIESLPFFGWFCCRRAQQTSGGQQSIDATGAYRATFSSSIMYARRRYPVWRWSA